MPVKVRTFDVAPHGSDPCQFVQRAWHGVCLSTKGWSHHSTDLLCVPKDCRKVCCIVSCKASGTGHRGWADSCLADAKLASPKLAKHTSCIGNGRTMTEVSTKAWASRKTRLPSSKVSTVADVIPFCKHATFMAMSGLESTAASWRPVPQRPFKFWSSLLVTGLVVSDLLGLGMSMCAILWIYRPWFTYIEKSSSCSMSEPVNLNLLYSRVPNGRLF